jgi:hypothetical protein
MLCGASTPQLWGGCASFTGPSSTQVDTRASARLAGEGTMSSLPLDSVRHFAANASAWRERPGLVLGLVL